MSLAVVDGFLRSQFICSANGALVVFSTTDMPAKLVVHQSVLNVKSAGDAWKIVQKELQARGLRPWDEDDQKYGLHVIPMNRLIKEDFFVPRAYAESATRPLSPPTIESIETVGGNWSIALSGANRMKATMLLDSKYQVISTRVEVGH